MSATNGNILLNRSNPSSYSTTRAGTGNAGNGGAVSFSTSNGNISLIDSLTLTQSRAEFGSGNAGDAGAISFSASNGNITLDNSPSVAISQSNSVNIGNGGAISFLIPTVISRSLTLVRSLTVKTEVQSLSLTLLVTSDSLD